MSGSDDDSFMIFPLTELDHDADIEDGGGDSAIADSSGDERHKLGKIEPPKKRPLMTLRERRRSKLGLDLKSEFSQIKRLQSVDSGYDEGNGSTTTPASPGKQKWMLAMKKIKRLKDPWAKFHLEQLTAEKCKRYRFNALKKEWKEDEVIIKIEPNPFDRGAMRECFRLKKLSQFSKTQDWRRAANYVAKKYIEDVDRSVYFEDVRLQMDAKLWGEEYDRHNPPKKVDVVQMCVLEFLDRPDKPLYHLEHFIDGEYIKYNSNTGFVEEHLRFTPQAFSHFTFERSAHNLILVDIQGVGDLWTDPQIHTVDGKGYGDGNLGTRGMALFFHSHVCNSICESLSLSKFDMAPSEIENHDVYHKMQQQQAKMVAHTRTRGMEEQCYGVSPLVGTDYFSLFAKNRSRTISEVASEVSDGDSVSMRSVEMDVSSPRPTSEDELMSPVGSMCGGRRNRVRFTSESEMAEQFQNIRSMSESEQSMTDLVFSWLEKEKQADDLHEIISPEEEEEILKKLNLRNHRGSCIADEMKYRSNLEAMGDSVLGLVHHEMAKYHELGRFAMNDVIDWEAALYHEKIAADLGIMEAIITIAKIYLGQEPDVLVGCIIPPRSDNHEKGVEYMELAAELGDRAAMLFMAQALETGEGLDGSRERSYRLAVDWYNKALTCTHEDEDGGYDATMDNPPYIIKAKLAAMYLAGGYELDKDPSNAGDLYNEAAEDATAKMKGRLASKYYQLAEEAYAQVEE